MKATIPSRVVIATRGSALALWQSRWVVDRLAEVHPDLKIDLHIVKTTGDRFQEAALQAIGGKGAFTKEITEAILRGEADLAVHSLKDLPTQAVPGLRVWAHPPRFDPRDAWIGREGLRYRDLPRNAVVATGSLRRRAQLLAQHPHARVEEIRGNVETRLRKFDEGSMNGMFLAIAGLERLGFAARVTEALEVEMFLPAPGQGALAIEGREDAVGEALLTPLDDVDTRDAVTAERAFLAALEAGCQVPLGATARLEAGSLVLRGLVASLDGKDVVRGEARGDRGRADALGRSLAAELREQGAGRILEEVRRAGGPS
jgi:hydroxymethylbilane synthase